MTTPSVDHLHQTTVELARLGGVDAASLDTPIPHIDGWSVRDVVGHTGWVCRYVDLCLEADPDQPPSRALVPEPPPGPDVVPWFDDARTAIVDHLNRTDLNQPRPTWTGAQPASWWLRRIANEAAMHRWDAYSATASPEPIDAALAKDGIDEVLDVFAPNRLDFDLLAANGATLHLHATDADDGEWMVTIGDTSLSWERSHGKGDVAARGPMSDLLLMLWSRIPPSRLEVFGDATLLERWQDAAAF